MYDPNFKKEIDAAIRREIVFDEFIDNFKNTSIYNKERIVEYLQAIIDDELCKGSLDF